MTLKMGIERKMRESIPEVSEVVQVLWYQSDKAKASKAIILNIQFKFTYNLLLYSLFDAINYYNEMRASQVHAAFTTLIKLVHTSRDGAQNLKQFPIRNIIST